MIIVSCNEKTSTDTNKKETATDTSKIEYAYTVDHDWEWGSRENTQMVLSSLKAFEKGNVGEAVKDFGDTVTLQFDNFEAKLSKDSLLAFFKKERGGIKNMTVKMDDYESVKSKDGKYEYVSLWYKQISEDLKGKTDSIECMDDLGIKNGKIILLNEKIRHYAVKKTK